MLLGDLLIWLFEDIAGIKSNDAAPAFREIMMRPSFDAGLNEADASYESPYGKIASHWKIQRDTIVWDITIPANASAAIHIPAKSAAAVNESGKTISGVAGLAITKWENGVAVIKAGSGQYRFLAAVK
jgi:alpha-L-rhamnosidase